MSTTVATPKHTFESAADQSAAGKALRHTVPLKAHSGWIASANRRDPVDVLKEADVTRLPQLVPLRYGRMLQSAFTFYRGSAAVMAADLAQTPATGIHVQCCGDAHLLNFGGFASPERRLLFDINDLDETLPAPWEWDVKRLVASFVLAARSNGLKNGDARDAAVKCAHSYRRRMREFARMDVLEAWYSRIEADDISAILPHDWQATLGHRIEKATSASSSELVFPKLTESAGEKPRIRDTPPTLFHPDGMLEASLDDMLEGFAQYRLTLQDDRRVLFDRYEFIDAAVKVVGIGSVGTACFIALFASAAGNPLFLQMKEANASVLEAYAGASAYAHHGERVVQGQRLLQPASDLFLGWATGKRGRTFYVRQLRDVKLSPLIETFDASMLMTYGRLCGWALARAHAKANGPWAVAGYLGKGEDFDEAMGDFAVAYADQAERDYEVLKAAVRAGRIDAQPDR